MQFISIIIDNWKFLIYNFAILLSLSEIFRIGRLLLITRSLARFTRPYSHHPARSVKRLLMTGDSYAVGLGASIPEKTFTGLFSKDFPDMDITNLSKSGISTRRLLKYLLKKEEFSNYDRAIVIIGGMDIINLTPLTRLELSLTALISLLKQHCKEIILVIPGHAGLMPIFNWPLSAILNHRSRKVRRLFKHVAREYGVEFLEEHVDLLLRDRDRYYAMDKHHPNDQGYEIMYSHMREAIEKINQKEIY